MTTAFMVMRFRIISSCLYFPKHFIMWSYYFSKVKYMKQIFKRYHWEWKLKLFKSINRQPNRPRLRAHAEMPEVNRNKQKHKRGSCMGSGCQTHRRVGGNERPVCQNLQVSTHQTRYTSCWSQALIVIGHNLGERLAPPTRLWSKHLLAGLLH